MKVLQDFLYALKANWIGKDLGDVDKNRKQKEVIILSFVV